MPAPPEITEETEAALDVKGSTLITGCRLPVPPKGRPHPFELLSPDYQLARAMEYFALAEELIDEIGESPEWRSKPEYAYLVNDIGRVCETINKLLGQRDWPLSESTDVKRVARNTCALAKQTSNTVRQEARRKTVQIQKAKVTPPPLSPTDSAAPVTRVVIESRPQLPDISALTDASSMLSSLPDTDAQSMSPREYPDDDTSSTRPLLNYPDLPVV